MFVEDGATFLSLFLFFCIREREKLEYVLVPREREKSAKKITVRGKEEMTRQYVIIHERRRRFQPMSTLDIFFNCFTVYVIFRSLFT